MEQKKKIPLRQCVGCCERKPKGELIRVVRTPEGEIVLDSTGRKNGRGCYLCASVKCFNKAKKSGKKCIGCPDGCSCAHKGGAPSSGCGCGCSGEKTACSCHTEP